MESSFGPDLLNYRHSHRSNSGSHPFMASRQGGKDWALAAQSYDMCGTQRE